MVVVGDRPEELATALADGLRADLCVVSGGLGPTHDDRTVELLAAATGRAARAGRGARGRDRGVFPRRRSAPRTPVRRLPARHPQAGHSAGRRSLSRSRRNRPGDPAGARGRPDSRRPTWAAGRAAPTLAERRRARSGSSAGGERADQPEAPFPPLLRPDGVGGGARSRGERGRARGLRGHRLCARPRDPCRSRRATRRRGGSLVGDGGTGHSILLDLFARDDERPVEEIVLDLCRDRGLTLATAESCTGGLIGARLTEVAGASDVFVGGVIAYSNEVKERKLGVPAELLREHGAVSAEVGAAMASGARRELGADLAVADTGIAGPGGGTPEKPVGLVFLAVDGPGMEPTRPAFSFRATGRPSAPGRLHWPCTCCGASCHERPREPRGKRSLAWRAMSGFGSSAHCSCLRLRWTPSSRGRPSSSLRPGNGTCVSSRGRTSTSRSRFSAALRPPRHGGGRRRPAGGVCRPGAADVRRPSLPRDEERGDDRVADDGGRGGGIAEAVFGAGGPRPLPAGRAKVAAARHGCALPQPSAAEPALPDLNEVAPSDAAVMISRLRPGGAQYEVFESVSLGG